MKVTNERIQSAIAPRRANGSGSAPQGAAFAGLVNGDFGADEGPETTSVRAATAIDSLLSAQEVPDFSVGRRRAVEHGRDLLDQLDTLRVALIAGAIPHQRLRRLVASLAAKQTSLADPGLAAVLDEIELRARVELAKYDARQ